MKHIPLRTCVACRASMPKRELVRIVRVAPDRAEVDTTGKKNGRGSYLCPAQECWHLAEKKKSLNHALEITVSADNWKSLWEYAQGLPEHKVLKRAEREAEAVTAPGRENTWDGNGKNPTKPRAALLSRNEPVGGP